MITSDDSPTLRRGDYFTHKYINYVVIDAVPDFIICWNFYSYGWTRLFSLVGVEKVSKKKAKTLGWPTIRHAKLKTRHRTIHNNCDLSYHEAHEIIQHINRHGNFLKQNRHIQRSYVLGDIIVQEYRTHDYIKAPNWELEFNETGSRIRKGSEQDIRDDLILMRLYG